ncbi:hypothetical protein BD560DRAFT_403137 [Blakeslea trispora]|nr:hypothetical protein BD560DRAFT_403137 [Blakeslea trispora]
MNTPIRKEQGLTKYMLMSLALLQSEVYWLCSVFYCLFHPTQGSTQKPNFIKVHPLTTRQTKLKEEEEKEEEQEEQEEQEKQVKMGIRTRPTVIDELQGTTCPPVWWQKTRTRLGKPAVPGDCPEDDHHHHRLLRRRRLLNKLNMALHHKHT